MGLYQLQKWGYVAVIEMGPCFSCIDRALSRKGGYVSVP